MTRKYPICECGHSSDRHDWAGDCMSGDGMSGDICECDEYREKNTKANKKLRAECDVRMKLMFK